MGKFNIEFTKKIFSGFGFELLDDVYTGVKTKMTARDSNGYLYYLNLDEVKGKGKHEKFQIVHKGNIYSLDNIKHYLKINGYDYLEVVSTEYKSNSDNLQMKCSKHGDFVTTWARIPRGVHICPKCAGRLTELEEVKKVIAEVNPNIEILSTKYITNKTPLTCKCLIDGNIWTTNFANLQRSGCPVCALKKIGDDKRYNINKVKNELFEISPNITITSKEYFRSDYKLDCVCEKGHKFKSSWDNLKQGKGCPICKQSKLEKAIYLHLTDNNINFKTQKRFDDCRAIKPLPFDFYVPELNLCIEADGIQHSEPCDWFGGEKQFKKQQEYDNIKNEFCKSNNINLLRIRHDEIDFIPQILEENVLTKL